MSFAGYLFDEHVPHPLIDRIRRAAPALPLHAVGRGDAPRRGTPDPDLLAWIEAHDCVLVTSNRRSMPVHLGAHLAAGRHVPGILTVPPEPTEWSVLIDELLLIWHAARPDEFRDRIDYLPLG